MRDSNIFDKRIFGSISVCEDFHELKRHSSKRFSTWISFNWWINVRSDIFPVCSQSVKALALLFQTSKLSVFDKKQRSKNTSLLWRHQSLSVDLNLLIIFRSNFRATAVSGEMIVWGYRFRHHNMHCNDTHLEEVWNNSLTEIWHVGVIQSIVGFFNLEPQSWQESTWRDSSDVSVTISYAYRGQ